MMDERNLQARCHIITLIPPFQQRTACTGAYSGSAVVRQCLLGLKQIGYTCLGDTEVLGWVRGTVKEGGGMAGE